MAVGGTNMAVAQEGCMKYSTAGLLLYAVDDR